MWRVKQEGHVSAGNLKGVEKIQPQIQMRYT